MDAALSAVRDALLLCGGEGSRLRAGGVETEKPLVEVAGDPMLDRVATALADSAIERVHAVVSPQAPATRERAAALADEHPELEVIETPGEGYVSDLDRALERVGRPALTAAADLPLVRPPVVDRLLATHGREGGSVTACVPASLKRCLGASVDTTFTPDAAARVLPPEEGGRELAPAGLNVVGAADDPETVWVSHDARLAVNVNRPADLEVAARLAGDGSARRNP